MESIRTIEFEGHIEGGHDIRFDRALLFPLDLGYVPFALIQFSINGKNQTNGLRLDLDKRTFLDLLDNVDNPDMRAFIERSAERIADFVQERFVPSRR